TSRMRPGLHRNRIARTRNGLGASRERTASGFAGRASRRPGTPWECSVELLIGQPTFHWLLTHGDGPGTVGNLDHRGLVPWLSRQRRVAKEMCVASAVLRLVRPCRTRDCLLLW